MARPRSSSGRSHVARRASHCLAARSTRRCWATVFRSHTDGRVHICRYSVIGHAAVPGAGNMRCHSPASGGNMEWSARFAWDGLSGDLHVECIPNADPMAHGSSEVELVGFPVCTARVRYPRRGYHSMFGWVQLVRSSDNASHGKEFEPDPFALFGDARSPYCWYGTEPTLFDAPSRLDRSPLEWLAYSFLATTPVDEVMRGQPRRVLPLSGFAWGFDVHDDGSVELRSIDTLTQENWATVLPSLRSEYPAPLWTFADSLDSTPDLPIGPHRTDRGRAG